MSDQTTDTQAVAPEPAPDAGDTPQELSQHGRSRRVNVIIWVATVLMLAAAAAIAALLFLPDLGKSDEVLADKPPPKNAPSYDGLVQQATNTKFVLRTREGKQVTLIIREPDRPYLDVQHAQSHAALGQPVRVFHKKVDGEQVAVYLEDSPLIF